MDPLLLPPRRETSRRKAKEKTSVKQFLDRQQGIDYFDNDEEQADSDSDPAWTPAVKLAGDEEEKRKKRARPVITKKIRKILEEDGYSSGEIIVTKKSARKKHEMSSKNSNSSGKVSCKIDEKLIASVSDEDIDISPFKVIYITYKLIFYNHIHTYTTQIFFLFFFKLIPPVILHTKILK